jgi:hypothetical protein
MGVGTLFIVRRGVVITSNLVVVSCSEKSALFRRLWARHPSSVTHHVLISLLADAQARHDLAPFDRSCLRCAHALVTTGAFLGRPFREKSVRTQPCLESPCELI